MILRPHLVHFLQFCFRSFEGVGLFSASMKKTWIEPILEQYIYPLIQGRFSFIWDITRCKCSKISTSFETIVKPLEKLWNEYPEMNECNTVIVDDSGNDIR